MALAESASRFELAPSRESFSHIPEVLPLALEREQREGAMRQRYAAGELSYDLQGLRALVEGE